MPQKFTAQHVRASHPAGMTCRTDFYYAKVGNQVLKILTGFPDRELLDEDTLIRMTEKLTLYLEDIICDLGIWRTFVDKHRQLYGKFLPFYDTKEEYFADEPHLSDVQFLIWDTLTEMKDDSLLNPTNPAIKELAAEIYLTLDEEFEKAPINEEMKQYFEKAGFLSDYITLRDQLHWVFDGCYLTSSFSHEDNCVELAMHDVVNLLHMDEYDPRAEYAALTQCYFKYKVGPLALYPQEWLAMILRHNGHQEAADEVERIKYHPYDLYRLEDFNDTHVFLCDSDDMHFCVRKDDYGDLRDETLLMTDGCVAAFIQYRGEWHPNGMDMWNDFGTAHEEYRENKHRYKTGISEKTYQQLMEKSGGSPLFYFRNGEELRRFNIEEMKVPEHLVQPSPIDKEEYLTLWMPSADVDFYIAPDSALGIKDSRNPYYDPDKAQNALSTLLFSPTGAPADMVRYLESRQMIPDAAMQHHLGKEEGQRLTHENMDFLVRTLRRENY